MDKEKNKEWITTAELIAYLKAHPDDEKECRLYLGHRLGSTHYWYWDAKKRTFMHTRDWPFSPISESEVKEWYGNSKWKIEQWTNVVSRHDTIVSRHNTVISWHDTTVSRHKWPIRVKCTIQRYYSRSVLVRSSFGPRSVLVRFSFILRSSFVRDSFGIRRTIKESTKKQRKCIWGTTEAQQRMNEAKTMPKRCLNRRSPFAFQNDSFCLSKGLLLQSKTTPFRHQKDYIRN